MRPISGKARGAILAIDTEVNGVDFFHGARPFFFTSCDDAGGQAFCEWDVDPLTREPHIPDEDVREIQSALDAAESVVGQNLKFDSHALDSIGVSMPWEKVEDTLVAGHVLASNHPHDLTSMALEYLGKNIKPFEDRLEAAVKEARGIAKREFGGKILQALKDRVVRQPKWMLADKALPCMPSAANGKTQVWRYDYWVPRAVAQALGYATDHKWWTVLQEYANVDSAITLKLWLVQKAELERRGLWKIYREKMKNLPALWEMERGGVTTIRPALVSLRAEYVEEIAALTKECLGIAAGFGYDLALPKNGMNKSLQTFAFDVLKLPVIRWTDGGKAGNPLPSLNKDAIAEYKKILDPGGAQHRFVKALSGIRKREKSNEFLNAYEAHWVATERADVAVLHPNLNGTGTDTTRLSCNNPNLQQCSKQESLCESCHGDGCEECGGTGEDLHNVRSVFGPGPGREWWTADAANIELRIPAYESGEPDLIALFEKPDDPPFYGSQHMLNLSIVYDDLWAEEVRAVGLAKAGPHCKKKYGAAEYHWTKCGGLAMQYQCGEETADRTFRREGGYAKLKAHFARVAALNAKWVAFANRTGAVETMPDRAVDPERGYPLLCSRSERGGIVPTVPLNYRTQGTAGWWMVKAINRCHAQLKEWQRAGFTGRMVLTVHDELIFDFPKGRGPQPWRTNLPKVRKLQSLMEEGGRDIGVPTPVTVNYHAKTWAKGVVI